MQTTNLIAIYGDVLQDEYVYGESSRLSPEAPVPVVKFKDRITKPGGAGNVFENVKSIHPNCSLRTTGDHIPIKQRIYSNGHYVTRIDFEGECSWRHSYTPAKISVISDYNKGSFDSLDLSKVSGKTIVDPKASLFKYKNTWCLKPNFSEFAEFYTGNLQRDMQHANQLLNVEHLIVTLGKDGVAYSTKDLFCKFQSEATEVFDVTGAGDTFTAVLATSLAKDLDMISSIKLANKAAGVAVKHHGCYVIKPEDLQDKLIFTNGCFDILHPGHIKLLSECRKLGKVIVGLNSDKSIKKLKGAHRPVNSQEHRKHMLELLGFEVVLFDEETPAKLIEQIRPDVIVKGGDYKKEQVIGNELAEVIIIPLEKDYSTTSIINRTCQ